MQNEPEIWTSAVASSYYDLESKTIKLKRILDNPTLLVFHEIYDLRTAMLNVSPGAKTVKVLDMLINYEQKYENGSNIIKFDDAFKFELYNMVLELMTKLDHWHDFLFVRKHGVDDFGVIKNNIDNELSRINAKMDYLKQWIFDDELKQIKTEIDLLLPSKQHDFNDFEPKPKPKPESEKKELLFNSVIVDSEELKSLLWNLCRFSHQDTKWNLLYRASKDGFGASVFHTKCDNKPNTLTIIKTSQGYIFGGYTEADWSKTDPIRFQDLLFNPLHLSATRTGSKLNFKYDPEAFIFSLKNPENRILRIDVSNPNEAIHSHQLYGPSFGNGDILIVSDSNTHIYSFSDLSSSYVHPDITSTSDKIKSERFLTGSKHFKVADIEVFQKN